MLDGRRGPLLHFGRNHLRILVIGVFKRLRPALDDPAIVFLDVFRIEADASAGDGEGALGSQNLKPGFGRKLVIERGAQADGEALRILQQGVNGIGNVAAFLPAVQLAHGHHGRRHLRIHQVMDGGAEVHEQVGGDAAGVVLITAPAEKALEAEGALGRRPEEHFPVHCLGRGVGRNRIDPGARGCVAVVRRANHGDFAQLAGENQIPGLAVAVGADALAADLHDPARRACGVDDLDPF